MLEKSILAAARKLTLQYLPNVLRGKTPIHVDGTAKPGFQEVVEAFKENFTCGLERHDSGSAFAVYHRGRRVVNVFGGYADTVRHQLWKEDTLSIVFSVTKAVAAICIAVLVDRGVLAYDRPVAHYWPEFAANGKENITVQQLLEHKAGLAVAPQTLTYKLLADSERCSSVLAATAPLWPIGSSHGYHAVSFGPLVGELLRRADPTARSMGRFFAEEIAEPLGIDFFIGLPLAENRRAAKLTVPKLGPSLAVKALRSSRNRQAFKGNLKDRKHITGNLLTAIGILKVKKLNHPELRAIEVPSFNGFGTAESLAKLMGILAVGGTDPETGRTLVSRERAESFMESEPETMDRIAKIPTSWRLGMFMDRNEDGRKIFGHPGIGGSVAFTDPHHQLGYAFITRGAGPFGLGDDPRYLNLRRALYKCVKHFEGNT